MSSSGVGRGRGWLNLNKSQNAAVVPPRPGGIPSPSPVNPLSSNVPLINDDQFANTSNDFSDLVDVVKQLSLTDDGIKFLHKQNHIVETWKESCHNSEDVERCFNELHQLCLHDTDLASKLVHMVSARSFINEEVHDHNIRLMFLRKLQNDFEGSKLSQKTDPDAFRNNVQMLGQFYNKARLANGQRFTFMAIPLISYLEMLLESANTQDLKLFTMQLHLNGACIKIDSPDKIIEILNNIRLLLASIKTLSRDGRFWLLLALDVANNKFALPSEVYKFYEEQLGETAMASFQGVHGVLSVQTIQGSATLDTYQSTVNVLQVSTPAESANNSVAPSDLNSSTFSSSGFASDTSSHSSILNRDSNSHSGKHGRPILGSGARFNKNKSNDESAISNWGKTCSNRQKSQGGRGDGGRGDSVRGDGRKNTKTGKGWEHDDRFETDYS